MIYVVQCLICLFFILLTQPVQAELDLSLDKEFWQAEQIKVFWQAEKVKNMHAALEGKKVAYAGESKLTKNSTLKEQIDAGKTELDKTIQAFGFIGSSEVVSLNAKIILNRKDYVEGLTKKYDAESDSEKKRQFGKQKKMAIFDLNKFIQKVMDGRQANQMVQNQEALRDLADSRFRGFGFGVAIAGILKAGSRDKVQNAIVDPNNIVRVERDNNFRGNFILESHYFFSPSARFLPLPSGWIDVDPNNWGHGPFVAIQPGTDNIIEALGMGWMFGFRRTSVIASEIAPELGDSFNLGFGILVDPNTKVLGDGIVANQSLPSGENDVRLKTTTELNWLFLFSYSF